MRHAEIKIFGMVQGVNFRYFAFKTAHALGVTGFAQNCSDGSVYIEVEGEAATVEQFITECRQGPSFANVERVEVHDGSVKGFRNFEIQ
jgi:acylphosphatase